MRHLRSALRLFALSLSIAILSACSDDETQSPSDNTDTTNQTDTPDATNPTDATSTTTDTAQTTADADLDTRDTSGATDTNQPTDTNPTDTSDADIPPPPVGLTSRPANPNCIAPPRAETTGPLQWVPAEWGGEGGLNLMMIRQAPDGTWFEIYRSGEVFQVDAQGERSPELLSIDVPTEGEMGLLGFDLHPNWPAEPHLFFYYTTLNGNSRVHIDRYTANNPTSWPVTIDAASRVEIFNFDRGNPWTNHLGGSIEFDPNSATPMLYAAMGDAEEQSEVQDPTTLYGKLIRIDVSAPPYTPEIVGMGLRNPFRWSFDSVTGDLWIGDVGAGDWEEVSFVPASEIPAQGEDLLNFGWPIMEGFACRTGSDPANSCGHSEPLLLPAHAYGRNLGVSVIGGRAYRGTDIVGIDGQYFFNDIFPQGGEEAWTLTPNPNQDPGVIDDDFTRAEIPTAASGFVSYSEDLNGELYAVVMWGGIYKLEADDSGNAPVETMPAQLSQTGCFGAEGAPAQGLVPYDINAPLWSDGAEKTRWLSLPDGEQITLTPEGDFEFPPGTVLAKEFTQEGVRVETRLFVRHPDGVWAGYSYAWIDENGAPVTDAQLLPDSVVTRPVPDTAVDWTYPSRGQCTGCHTAAAGGSLGLEIGQLNRDLTYPSTGITANQVHTLSQIGMIDGDVSAFNSLSFPPYDSPTAPPADLAWSYLHSNCANCHQDGGPGFGGRSNMPDLRFDLFADRSSPIHPLAARLCNVEAGAGDLGLGAGAKLVEPGVPGDWNNLGAGGSVLYLRMAARPNVPGSTGTMPQLGTARIDDQHGLPLLGQWIQTLTCP